MKTVDVRGLSCPEPVMMVKGELAHQSELLVLANEAHTVKNITRLAEQAGKSVTVKEVADEYEMTIR